MGDRIEDLVAPLNQLWADEVAAGMRVVVSHPGHDIDGYELEELAGRLRMGVSVDQTWHWTDLRGSDPAAEDPLWSALSAKARQNIRRARRSGVTVTVETTRASLAEFELLHRRLRREKYRLLSQPERFFDALHHHFHPGCFAVVLARLEDRPVAGVVLIRHGDWAYYKFNASNTDGWASRANDLVMWEAVVHARQWGCRRFDHGISDLDQPGLIRYKDKFATGRRDVATLRRSSANPPPWTLALDRGLTTITRLMTAERCPPPIADRASRHLYRLFC